MKRILIILLSAVMLILSGCSRIDQVMEDVFLQKANISSNAEYQQYQQFLSEGKLDDDGTFHYIPEVAEDAVAEGMIHVTFAENRYIDISYYKDAAKTIRLNPEGCYLAPGDCIYSAEVEIDNSNSNSYKLAEFRILSYDGEEIEERFAQPVSEDGLVFQIPNNFACKEMSIIPVGEYEDRELKLAVFYTDKNGQTHELESAGTWYINGQKCNSDSAYVSSVETYVLKFDYDQDHYFYVGSTPACFTEDPSKNHEVEFWEATPVDKEEAHYSIELREYLSLAVKTNKEARVKLNGKDQELGLMNKTWQSGKLQFGDVIVVETAGNCTVSGDYQYLDAYVDPIGTEKRYTIKITPECSGNAADKLQEILSVERNFDLTVNSDLDHCTCIFKLDGKVQKSSFTAQEGQKLTITCEITEKGYIIEPSNSGFKGALDNLFNRKKKTVTIDITEDLDGKTICASDYFTIEREED